MLQKAKNGGTPGMAPFGYRNTQQLTDEGREIRTVVIDPARAEQVRWIYQAYASGEWTMAQLRDEMAERSVTTLPKPGRPARPIAISHIEVMLKNRYYLGLVKFEDVWYPGKHEALITGELWHRVQEVPEPELPAPKAVDFLRAIERPRGQLPWQRKTSALRTLVLTNYFW